MLFGSHIRSGKHILLFSVFWLIIPLHAQVDPKNDPLLKIQESLKPPLQDFVQAIFDLVPFKRKYPQIIRDTEWKELECDLMVQKLDRTKTIFGFWGLRELSYPIAHARELTRRQMIVKKLATDYYFRKKIEHILDDIKTADKEVVAYWNVNDQLNVQSRDLYYSFLGSWTRPISEYCNRSRIALEGSAIVSYCSSAFSLALGLGAGGIIAEAFEAFAQRREVSLWNGIVNGFKQPINVNSPYSDVCKEGFDMSKMQAVAGRGTGGDIYEMYSAAVPRIVAGTLALASVGYLDYLQYEGLKGRIKHFAMLKMLNNALFVRTVHLASFFRAIEKLHAMVQSNIVIFGNDIKEALDFKQCSATFQELVRLLKTETFDSPESNGYSRGKVLLANQLMNDVKDELIPLLHMVAQIDGYHSIATLYKEQNKQQAPFCFVEFANTDMPCLKCEKCWTPLLPTDKPVLNSFDWDESTHTKMVLTGPNGSGKSTVMKAISHAIILAQSWGICPAHKANMRLFTGLRSSLSPREDLQQNLSTFMAEKRRIDDIKEYILKYNPEDCFFVLLDEPYRGTVESEAEYRIDLLAKEMIPLKHCMMIMATHLEAPTKLPENTGGVFANYQLGLEEQTDGSFIRTFTLLPGFAEWWFKDMLKRRRFIDQLLCGN